MDATTIAIGLYLIPVLHRMTMFSDMSEWAHEMLSLEKDGEKLAPIVVPLFTFTAIALWPIADLYEGICNLLFGTGD